MGCCPVPGRLSGPGIRGNHQGPALDGAERSSPHHPFHAGNVVVEMEAKEYVGTIAEGVQYKFWSFNGTVPGP